MIAMSEEAKVIAFVAFCVESYKAAKNLSGEGVSSLFTRFGGGCWGLTPLVGLSVVGFIPI